MNGTVENQKFSSRQEYEDWKKAREALAASSASITLNTPNRPPGRAAIPSHLRPGERPASAGPNYLLWAVGGFIMLIVLVAGIAWFQTYQNSDIDPRCSVEAEGRHRTTIAKYVNRSKMWKAYFDIKQPSRGTASPLVVFSLTMDRRTRKSVGGDYDPGKVIVTFKSTNLANGKVLFKKEGDLDLEPFMVGFFEKDMTREQYQEIAYKATEENIYPFLHNWIKVSAITAMGHEGSNGTPFLPILDELLEDGWNNGEVLAAARKAVLAIKG